MDITLLLKREGKGDKEGGWVCLLGKVLNMKPYMNFLKLGMSLKV